MSAQNEESKCANRTGAKAPPLKSASGSGFSFEDKVAALLFAEMLVGRPSLGSEWGVAERVERQAPDWEPFGDLLLTVRDHQGKPVKCGCSVKSNRQVNSKACDPKLQSGLWQIIAKPIFDRSTDMLGLFCAELSHDVSTMLNQFCKQSRQEPDARRLDEKITHAKHRKIYSSFASPADEGDPGLPRHVLAHLIPREFDFEDVASKSEAEAVALCREALCSEAATEQESLNLWKELLAIAKELRDTGGSVTLERLASKIRGKLELKDDPSDIAAWARIRRHSRGWMDEIRMEFPGGLVVPRNNEATALRQKLSEHTAIHLIGESGSGKSALVKAQALDVVKAGGESVWVKSEQFGQLLQAVPDFTAVLRRTRRKSALLVFDALDGCYDKVLLENVARAIGELLAGDPGPWKVVLICQTSDWSRITRVLSTVLAGQPILAERVLCGNLSNEDLAAVCQQSASIRRLSLHGHLRRILASVKVLDVLLSGQLAEETILVGEADLVEWWWEEQVRKGKHFAAEESVARLLGKHMADGLVTELSPDKIDGPADAVNSLIERGVLRRTQDGRIRFDHDLLADWSRVMHLRSLGSTVFDFMVANAENPPWLRAIRLLSQHFLERSEDLEQWRRVLESCAATKEKQKEPLAQNLQVLDAWLEGIVYCTEARKVIDTLKPDLLADGGDLLKRLVRRLLHSGTIPDPVVQQRMRQFDTSADAAAGLLYRLPVQILWSPLIDFLVANKDEATDFIPVELADVALMWARLEEYLGLAWPDLADVVLFNGEKELRREVSGEYRPDRSRHLLGPNNSRVAIYTAALHAASQLPSRAAKLVLKAAGRAPWEEGDISNKVREEWRGEWRESSIFSEFYVELPDGTKIPKSWPYGPTRQVSTDFSHAWVYSNAAIALYRNCPDASCEATLGFLIDWPKQKIRSGSLSGGLEHYGFASEAVHMPLPFWTKGNFLMFLRQDWRPALQLIVRLTDFATDRYEDWWPYETRVEEVKFPTSKGTTCWKGNDQIYAWHRQNMNTADIVTCALMALEKWFDERLGAERSISEAVELLYSQGHSVAFAGILVSIGKRHPRTFLDTLKPLLFARQFYFYDIKAVRPYLGGGVWPKDGKIIENLRRDWNQLPGRRTHLKECCHSWLLEDPELQVVFEEISKAWRKEAGDLPPESEQRLIALRMAADFERSRWKEITLPDGRRGWTCERPTELDDAREAERIGRIQHLIMLPYKCSDWLDQGQPFDDEQLDIIWQQLQNWTPFERLGTMKGEREDASEIRDHRHGRAGLLALLLCAGESWLEKHPGRREWLQYEVLKILSDPPRARHYGPDEVHDDYETLLARAVVRCWVRSPADPNWRGQIASLVTAYRYRTVLRLFQEALRVRHTLGEAFRELEGLILAFAVVRKKATQLQFLRTRSKTDVREIQKWGRKWLPAFTRGKGPKWSDEWSGVESIRPFPRERHASAAKHNKREEVYRRDYGLDMDIILASFGQFPSLSEACNIEERTHWLSVCEQMVAAFCRTLPSADERLNPESEWRYEHWSADEKIFTIVARRLFDCNPGECRKLWEPIISLPFAAHHHIRSLLSQLVVESLRTQPYRIAELASVWRDIAKNVFTRPTAPRENRRNRFELQKHVLLYDSVASQDEFWAPLIEELRPWFKVHLDEIWNDAHDLSSFARFLTTKAGALVLIDALIWLQPAWELASEWFWESVVEDGHFAELLEHAWREHFDQIRVNPIALKTFKVLTLKLAAHHVPIAIEVQRNL